MNETPSFNIVVVQLDMTWEDKPANHKRVRQLLAEAQPEHGSLIVLPEMFETGFSMNVDKTAQSEERTGEALLKELAQQYQSAVLGGVISPDDSTTGVSNQAVCFGSDGTELVRYQKMQPFTAAGEERCYPAGDSQQQFQWSGAKISPFICYDLRFPELFRPAAIDGAEVMIVIACWPAVRSEHWVRLLQARAIENQAFVIGVNRCGTEPGLEFDGRSAGFSPLGETLFETDDREQTVQVTINADDAKAWRAQFPALKDIRRPTHRV